MQKSFERNEYLVRSNAGPVSQVLPFCLRRTKDEVLSELPPNVNLPNYIRPSHTHAPRVNPREGQSATVVHQNCKGQIPVLSFCPAGAPLLPAPH